MSCKSRTLEITIAVEDDEYGDKKIALNHHTLVLKKGDTIKWNCSYPFFVHLGPKSPLCEMTYQSYSGGMVEGSLQEAPNDLYKYLIAVLYKDEGNGNERFIILDPDLIVRR